MGGMIGLGIISLVLYVAIILILNVGFKRRASEAMMWSYLIIVAIAGAFSKHSLQSVFVKVFLTESMQKLFMQQWHLYSCLI